MVEIAFVIIGVYGLLLILAIIAWLQLSPLKYTDKSDIQYFYSIIIPVRNEESNLSQLFESLIYLEFPMDKFEIIFVNDHSEDGTLKLLEDFKSDTKLKTTILNILDVSGKKAALKSGIETAKGDVILSTDGDCILPPNWLKSMASYFEQKDANFVFGGVRFSDDKNLFEKLQTIEFSSLIGTGAATLQLGLPSMCNGANLGFRKKVYLEIKGYDDNQHLPSGDDEFLLHKMFELDNNKVLFNKDSNAVVSTKACESFTAFHNQRKRWAGKWKHYASFKNSALALYIFVTNLIMAYVYLVMLLQNSFSILWISLVIKVVLEATFIAMVLNFLNKKLNLIHFLMLQITYPFYVIFFGIAANFGQYVWKGRVHKL